MTQHSKPLTQIISACLCAASLFFMTSHTQAATYLVDTLDDVVDANDGVLSLREAIDLANADAAADEIRFDYDEYDFYLGYLSTRTIALTGGQLVINHPLTIDGGLQSYAISAENASRVFKINAPTTLKNLLIENGNANYGGAVFTQADLTTHRVTFDTHNASVSGGAVAIKPVSGSSTLQVTLENSYFLSNAAVIDGGAIFIDDVAGVSIDLALRNVRIDGSNAGQFGGAIHTDVNQNSAYVDIDITGCSFTDNTANKDGGAIYARTQGNSLDANARVNITQCTFANNHASTGDGGVFFVESDVTGTPASSPLASLKLNNTSIAGNFADAGKGGAIYANITPNSNVSHSPMLTFYSSILVGNIKNGVKNNCSLNGEATTNTSNSAYNLVDRACGLSDGVNNNLVKTGVTKPLVFDGDASQHSCQQQAGVYRTCTETMALATGSLAINKGDANGLNTDQRGGARVVGSQADIGAYESGQYELKIQLAYGSPNPDYLGAIQSSSSTTAADMNPCLDEYCYAVMPQGTNVTMEIFPALGYDLSHWAGGFAAGSVDCSGSDNPYDLLMDDDKSCTAYFIQKEHTITVNATPASNGTASCSPNPVPHGGSASCMATANEGYVISSVDPNPTNVTEPLTWNASFAVQTYGLNLFAEPANGGSVTCTPNPVPHGGTTECTATPASGYSFDFFDGNCSGQTCVLENVTETKSVIAYFKSDTLNYYDVVGTASPAAGGSIVCSPVQVEENTAATCNATANPGWTFTGFSGDCAGATGSSCTMTLINGDKNVTANFVEDTAVTHTITTNVSNADHGTLSCTPNPVADGGNTTCTAIAKAGYQFSGFSGDCTGMSCMLENVTTAKSVTANFTPELTDETLFADGFE